VLFDIRSRLARIPLDIAHSDHLSVCTHVHRVKVNAHFAHDFTSSDRQRLRLPTLWRINLHAMHAPRHGTFALLQRRRCHRR
jgi:hypothetical protein